VVDLVKSKSDSHRISPPLKRLKERLILALQHLNTVDNALTAARHKHNTAAINYAITQNYASVIQGLYGQLNDYLKGVLSEMFRVRPLQVVGKAQEALQFPEIVRLGSYEAICDHMIDAVFRKLESSSHRSMQKLIETILSRTTVSIERSVLDDAMFYIEIRHLLVHNSGLIDAKFVLNYSSRFTQIKEVNNKLPLNKGLAREGIRALQKLCQNIDQELWRAGLIGE
jgi:hypothetical protein